MPKAWKKRTSRMGRGILSNEKMVFLARLNSALLLAMKIEPIVPESVQPKVNRRKARMNIAFSLTKTSAGDHKLKPAMNIPPTTRAISPFRVRQEFISSTGFWALGRKRMIATSRPSMLSKDKK
jgi:hypothetical protein